MTCCADRVEMEGEREVRGEEERRELLQASCEGHRRAAGVLQLECCKKKGQDGVFEMAIWKENSSPVVSESQESCLTETEEKAGKERELTAKRRREGEEEDEKTESLAKRKREEEEDEREGSMSKRKREGEEGGEMEESLAKRSKEEEEGDEGESDDEWVDIDPSQVPPHKEVVKKQRKKTEKAKPRGRERRKEANSTKAVDIRFAYPLPPRCSVKPHSLLTQSEHRLQAEVRRRGETMVVKVTSQSRTPAGLPWSICVELIHPEKSPLPLKAEEGAYGGRLGETLCTVEIPRSDLEQFVHKGVVCVRVCHS